MGELHTWAVWEKTYKRAGWGFRLTDAAWKLVSSHKTRIAADIAAKRGPGRHVRRASHGKPA